MDRVKKLIATAVAVLALGSGLTLSSVGTATAAPATAGTTALSAVQHPQFNQDRCYWVPNRWQPVWWNDWDGWHHRWYGHWVWHWFPGYCIWRR